MNWYVCEGEHRALGCKGLYVYAEWMADIACVYVPGQPMKILPMVDAQEYCEAYERG